MIAQLQSWQKSVKAFAHPRVVTMLFFGIVAGLPLLLIFSSLSLWLREAGVDRSAVTYFSWAALGYSFKFVWAPLLDVMPVPVLTRLLGRRRAWILVSQVLITLAIILMASVDPATDPLYWMAIAAVLLGFASATQDVVIDAFRIESADVELQALLSASYIAGYRIGMLLAGAGALVLASYFGSAMGDYQYSAWQMSYYCMAGLMLIGVITTLVSPEPTMNRAWKALPRQRHLGLLLTFAVAVSGFILTFYLLGDWAEQATQVLTGWVYNSQLASVLAEMCRFSAGALVAYVIGRLMVTLPMVDADLVAHSYVRPIKAFFARYGLGLAWLLLALVGLYRISDIVLGVIANVFYQDMGFTKNEIASIVKTFGLFMTIAGGFLGGILALRYGVMRILMLGAVLSALTNLLFMVLAYAGHDLWWLTVVISADNLSGGLASAAFIAFLSSLTNISFTAAQYAIFSSLMTLLPKVLGGYSGAMVDTMDYPAFFMMTAFMGVPVLVLIWLASKRFNLRAHESA